MSAGVSRGAVTVACDHVLSEVKLLQHAEVAKLIAQLARDTMLLLRERRKRKSVK